MTNEEPLQECLEFEGQCTRYLGGRGVNHKWKQKKGVQV